MFGGRNLPKCADWKTTEEEGKLPARRIHAFPQQRKDNHTNLVGLFNNSCAKNSWRTSVRRCLSGEGCFYNRPSPNSPVIAVLEGEDSHLHIFGSIAKLANVCEHQHLGSLFHIFPQTFMLLF